MAPGGLAVTTMGAAGADIRGDARVTVGDGPGRVTIESTIQELYGPQIRAQAEQVLQRFGSPKVDLHIEDTGALPFVLEARIEAALAAHLGLSLPVLSARPGGGRSARRTRLYVPGAMPKMMLGAGLYRPDVLILDLEDSVRQEDKISARALVRRALHTLYWPGCERAVRVNGGEQGREDIRAVADQGVDVFLLPKIESAAEVREVDTLLTEMGSKAALLPILESALGVVRSFEIAAASPRVESVAVGLEDYLTDIGAERTPEGRESAFAMGQVLNSARAAGVQPLASVYSRVDDLDGLRQYVASVRQLGFEGIGCIHPRQIRPVHEGFRPSDNEIERARRIVASFESDSRGAVAVDGQMVDVPVYERAQAVLRRAEGAR